MSPSIVLCTHNCAKDFQKKRPTLNHLIVHVLLICVCFNSVKRSLREDEGARSHIVKMESDLALMRKSKDKLLDVRWWETCGLLVNWGSWRSYAKGYCTIALKSCYRNLEDQV